MKPFQLLRTNPSITTNYTLNVTSEDTLYIESINSFIELNDIKYKHIPINKNSNLEFLFSKFQNGLDTNLSYGILKNEDPKYVYDDFSRQQDDLYRMGAGYVQDQQYKEEFEYFAPLHLGNKLPEHFIVFRVDGTGFDNITNQNFKTEIIDKLKFINKQDFNTNSNLGYFINTNTSKSNYPTYGINIQFKKDTPSYWNGFDYYDGGITKKAKILNDELSSETSPYKQEQFINEQFKNLGIIYAPIINFKFLFDDTPATYDKLKKYSLNRYYGFYIEKLEEVKRLTPYNITYKFKENSLIGGYQNYIIRKNTFLKLKLSNGNPIIVNNEPLYESADPIDGNQQDSKDNNYQFQYAGKFYKMNKDGSDYTIISDNFITIENTNALSIEDYLNNLVKFYNDAGVNKINYQLTNVDYTISDFNSSDIWLMKLGNDWFNLGENYIRCDEKIESDINSIAYTKGGVVETIDMKNISAIFGPPEMVIYKVALLDIKDFDFDRANSDFSRYDYEDVRKIPDTTEPKLFAKDYHNNEHGDFNYLESINRIPESDLFDNLIYQSIPVSSEYCITNDLFVDMSIQDKSQSINKQGYVNSLNTHQQPYRLLNYNLNYFNLSTNYLSEKSDQSDRNFDYFYCNQPEYNVRNKNSWNSVNLQGFQDNDLRISKNNVNIFNLEEWYLNPDYFENFFTYNFYYNDSVSDKIIKENKTTFRCYSEFGFGSLDEPSHTIFKGLKYNIKKVYNLTANETDTTIFSASLQNTNIYNGYKFSVLLQFTDDVIVSSNYQINENEIEENSDNVFYTKHKINVIINNNSKSILIRIEIPTVLENEITLDSIFPYNTKKPVGRIDAFLYRDNPIYNGVFDSVKSWKNANNAIIVNPKSQDSYVVLQDIDFLNSFNYVSYLNNFYLDEQQITQKVNIEYTIIDDSYLTVQDTNYKVYNLENKQQDYTLPVIIEVTPADIYQINSPGFKLTPNSLNLDISVDNFVNTTAEPIIKNMNYIKSGEYTSFNYEREVLPELFELDGNIGITQFKFSGYYNPIFKNINLFSVDKFNYKFDTELVNFGMVTETIISKINTDGSFLKTKNNPIDPLPRVDEQGYAITSDFIFKSAWDKERYLQFYKYINNKKAGYPNKTNNLL